MTVAAPRADGEVAPGRRGSKLDAVTDEHDPAAAAAAVLARRQAWRARREERKAKQRFQSVARAAAMHAARVAHELEHPARLPEPSRAPATGQLVARVGCSGWFYWHWRDHIYRGVPRDQWFEKYADTFRTVELNAPFYSWPTIGTVQTWVRQAGRRRFVYTVKVSELITHERRFVGTKQLVKDFGHIADLLGPRRMGCFLFQLPPSVHYSRSMLNRIVAQLDPERRNVVEFRHRSWWNDTVYAAFENAGIIFCSCSGPRLPDELVKTADDVYLRFHGTTRWYRHDYTKDELAVWVARIRSSGASRVWAYFNNDREGYAIKNARELIRQLKVRA
jgi:uncharacterized protein YecE (DUF72 family)